MNDQKNLKPVINFKLHLILTIFTGTLWLPFYQLICFLKLNELAEKQSIENKPTTKNNAIANFFFALSFFGTPFAFYRRFQLLRNYIAAQGAFRNPPSKKRDKEDADLSVPLNCYDPMKFVGFLIADFLIIAIAITTTTLTILHLTVNPSWTSDAFMIMLPIAMATFVLSITFAVRIIKEEKYWIEALTNAMK